MPPPMTMTSACSVMRYSLRHSGARSAAGGQVGRSADGAPSGDGRRPTCRERPGDAVTSPGRIHGPHRATAARTADIGRARLATMSSRSASRKSLGQVGEGRRRCRGRRRGPSPRGRASTGSRDAGTVRPWAVTHLGRPLRRRSGRRIASSSVAAERSNHARSSAAGGCARLDVGVALLGRGVHRRLARRSRPVHQVAQRFGVGGEVGDDVPRVQPGSAVGRAERVLVETATALAHRVVPCVRSNAERQLEVRAIRRPSCRRRRGSPAGRCLRSR